MVNTIEKNKRIIKNTLLLYTRMLLTMVIGLYTSRVVLDALGVDDFGIYNVVASITGMFVFFQSSLSNATQRYINIALAENKTNNIKKIFTQSFTIHIILGILVIIIGEILGPWFIREKLIIPINRVDAAINVFHFTLFSIFFTILQIPFISGIIARERMGIYAYIGIIEVTAKLLIVLLLTLYRNTDSLILYAFLLSGVTFIIWLILVIYCHKNFKEYQIGFYWNIPLIKDMSKFIGFNFIGCIGWTIGYQGTEIILNLFFGTIANAARGVANQVQSAVDRLTQNIIIAATPQITQLQALKEYNEMLLLVKRISKLTFCFMLILSVPIIIESHFLLSLWLKEIPKYAVIFTQLVLVNSLISILISPWHTVIFATGRIKNICIFQMFIMIFGLFLSYILLKLKFSITTPLIISILMQISYFLYHLYDGYNKVRFNIQEYIIQVLLPITYISIILIVPLIITNNIMDEGWYRLMTIGILDIGIGGGATYFLGLNRSERQHLKKVFLKKIKQFH